LLRLSTSAPARGSGGHPLPKWSPPRRVSGPAAAIPSRVACRKCCEINDLEQACFACPSPRGYWHGPCKVGSEYLSVQHTKPIRPSRRRARPREVWAIVSLIIERRSGSGDKRA